MAASPFDFVHYPISHSLLGACVWGLLLGGVYFGVRQYKAGAWVVAMAVVSHWVLDLPMHRPDLPLWPGSDVKVGFGLWSSIPVTIAVELIVLGLGLTIYLRRTRARDRVGVWALWAMVVALLAIFFSGFASPPPASQRAVAVAALGIWLFIPWGYWIDRHRDVLAQ
jgi:hypothetical protein